MDALTPIGNTRRADQDEGNCPHCGQPIRRGQRLVFIRADDTGHDWVHIRHLVERGAPDDPPRDTRQ